jgi:hypothetical protein
MENALRRAWAALLLSLASSVGARALKHDASGVTNSQGSRWAADQFSRATRTGSDPIAADTDQKTMFPRRLAQISREAERACTCNVTPPGTEADVETEGNATAEAEVEAEAEAEAEAEVETEANDEPSGEPEANDESSGEPEAETEPSGEPEAEAEPSGEPEAEAEPTGEPDPSMCGLTSYFLFPTCPVLPADQYQPIGWAFGQWWVGLLVVAGLVQVLPTSSEP